MSDIRSIHIRLLDDAFDMQSGYVLDFSNRTMGIFFEEELNIDIEDPRYARDGTSKANRLRCFLRTVDNATAARAIKALWEYRQTLGRPLTPDNVNVEGRVQDLVAQLSGSRSHIAQPPQPASNSQIIVKLRRDLADVWGLAPQARGYAFEAFLKSAFDLYGMHGKEAFRLRGEQIDGSFELDHSTYLLEGKWEAAPTGAADLHVFEGKLGEKAAWARGLFVSYTGFSNDGLYAFGRGKRTICMCGQDFDEAFARELPLDFVIRQKVRRAVETGAPFTPVRELG